MKKFTLITLSLILILSCFAGCAGGGDTTLDATIVIDGTLNDTASCYSLATNALERLKTDHNVNPRIMECADESAFVRSLQDASSLSEFVIVIGGSFPDKVSAAAAANPNTMFICIGAEQTLAANIYNVVFSEYQSAFLAGYIAAKKSTVKKVGIIGQRDDKALDDKMSAYEQGAKHADPACAVEKSIYTNPASGSADTTAVKAVAQTLITNGCDILYHTMGVNGRGVLDACSEKDGCYAIGSGADQRGIYPNAILCSTINEIGNVIYDTVSAYKKSQTWQGNSRSEFGLKDGYMAISYGNTENTPALISQELQDEVAALKTSVIDGSITIK